MIRTALILAGGKGTRLRPLTEDTPKPLLPIQGKPIVLHAIEQLKAHGVEHIILSIGYKAEKIKDFFGDGSGFGVSLSYVVEDEPLGTGGAIKVATRGMMEPLFVVWGDNLMDVDYAALNAQFENYRTPVTMVLTPREDVEHFGVAALEGEKIISFVEKPSRADAPSSFINAGAIVLQPERLTILPDGPSSIERDFYERLEPGEITAFLHAGQWLPTDTLEKYHYAETHFHPPRHSTTLS